MAYCVNCGVKLKKSEKECPLCNTIVMNPNIVEEYEPVYPNVVEEFKKVNYKYISKLTILILIILTLIVVLCDFVTSKKVSWSIYVICSSLYLSCHLSFLLYKNIYIPMIIELIGTELFLFSISYLSNGIHWYLYLILPFIFIIWFYVFLCVYLMKNKKKNLLRRLGICFFFSSIALLGIEISIDLYKYNSIYLNWSIYAVLPIGIISILILIISFNKKILDEVRQRMFF